MRVGVFCSSRLMFSPATLDSCREFSFWLGEQKHTLVYGGARVGLMGLVADAVLEKGGAVEGYIPRDLFSLEVPHKKIQKLVEVNDLFERKRLMMENSDAFVILPGGIGTLDEFFEVLTWRTLNCFDKPILIYNFEGFWDSLLTLMEDLRTKNVLHDDSFQYFKVCTNLSELKGALC